MKRLLVIVLLSLPFPLAAHAATSGIQIAKEVSQIEATTQRLRGLKSLRPVAVTFETDTQFDASYRLENQLDNPDSETEISQRESIVLGLLKKGTNLKKVLSYNLAAQVLAFYDYHHKHLYIRKSNGEVFGPERLVIAHEYTHALQDQHWGIARLQPDQLHSKYRNSDATTAHHSLLEGDAVNLQWVFVNKTYTPQDVRALLNLQAKPVKSPPLPTSINREFYFPYTTGVQFVETLYKQGGMREIDSAYARLPSSSYEIMHPSAYLRGWKPVAVSLHGVTEMNGWKQVDDDVFGAFGYNLLLWQFLPRATADRITNAYRGDRYVFLVHGAQGAMLLKSVWTSRASAQSTAKTFLQSIRTRYGRAHIRTAGPVVHTPDGGVYVAVTDDVLTIAYAPSVSVARQIGTARTS